MKPILKDGELSVMFHQADAAALVKARDVAIMLDKLKQDCGKSLQLEIERVLDAYAAWPSTPGDDE